MIFDPIKPYLAAIRIAGYIAIIGFLIISSCTYGKRGEAVRADKLETALGVCKDANNSNVATIKHLSDINAEYASQGAKQAEDVAQAQKDLKTAQKRIQAQEKAFNKELTNVYKKNPDWANQPVPADLKRLLNSAD